MTDSVLTEVNCRPLKIPKLHVEGQGSNPSDKQRVLKLGDMDDDEYVRQYLLFYYQFEKTQGFTVDWEQFDYVFHVRSLDNPPSPICFTRSHAEWIREMTLSAIEKHNEAEGTKLVLVEHVQANFKLVAGLLCWLTFWAIDLNSSSPESKIYQAKVRTCGKLFDVLIFRLKPTDEEIASVEVEPPSPVHFYDSDQSAVVFARAGPEDDSGVPFVFHRTRGGLES